MGKSLTRQYRSRSRSRHVLSSTGRLSHASSRNARGEVKDRRSEPERANLPRLIHRRLNARPRRDGSPPRPLPRDLNQRADILGACEHPDGTWGRGCQQSTTRKSRAAINSGPDLISDPARVCALPTTPPLPADLFGACQSRELSSARGSHHVTRPGLQHPVPT